MARTLGGARCWLASVVFALWSAAVSADTLADRAFESAQWVLATDAARAVAQVQARAAAGDGALAIKIRARQEIEARLDALRNRIANNQTQGGLTNDLRQVRAELDRIDAEIQAEFPDYAEFANPRPLDFAKVQAALADGEALVLFLADRNATYVWAVSEKAVKWHRAAVSRSELSALIREIRASLDPTGPARSATPLGAGPAAMMDFPAGAAHRLYRALLAPVEQVLDGADHVFVVKDGPISSLPLSVLLTEDLAAEVFEPWELREAPWLLRRFALTTLPSVSSLANRHSVGGSVGGSTKQRFIGFGDPSFAGDDDAEPVLVANRSIQTFFDDSGSRIEAIRALAPLPGTARELNAIAGLFAPEDARLVLGAEASEAAVKSADLSRYAILSFATHGLITGDISGLAEPALAFSPPSEASALDDGLLTASEAAALKLDADWVILSACNTAAGDGTPGAEGLSGLARAFLFAGARSILVSHWPVRDDAAAILTTQTLRRAQQDPKLGRSKALRQTILDILGKDSYPDALAHPSAWAPFVLVGDVSHK